METEERTHFQVLLEDIQTRVKVIAEGHGVLAKNLEEMESKFSSRFDKLETRFDLFASDTQQRLKRIESHLQLNGSSSSPPRPQAPRNSSPKRRKPS